MTRLADVSILAAHAKALHHFTAQAATARLVSFDLFDTLLVRVVGTPHDVFEVMAESLADRRHPIAAGFAQARIAAERRARERGAARGDNDVTLDDIYAAFDPASPGALQDIAALEAETEALSICADPQVKCAFDVIVASGVPVALVSDIYLPRSCIEAMLARTGIAGHRHLFLSGEINAAKANGTIWPHIRQAFGLAATDLIVHLGDNPEADGTQTAKAGVHPVLLIPPHARHRAAGPDRHRHWIEGSLAALAQQSLAHHRDDPAVDPYWLGLAHRIVLPAALGMARFVRDRAEAIGVERIHFLARDGLIFRKAYEAAWRRPEVPPSSYIWASRRCLNLPAIQHLDAPALDFLLSGTTALAAGDYLARIDLDPAASRAAVVLRQHGLTEASSINSAGGLDAMRAVLRDLEPEIVARATKERVPLLAHLEACGLFAGPGLVVDLGWHGSLQRSLLSLAHIWAQARGGRVPHFTGCYLGTFAPTQGQPAPCPIDTAGWLLDNDRPTAASAILRRSINVVELLFSAPESGIRHLDDRGGALIPVRNEDLEEAPRLRIAATIHAAVEAAAAALRPLVAHVPASVFHDIARANLAELLTTPGRADITAFASVTHAEGFGKASYHRIVPLPPVPSTRWKLYNHYNQADWPIAFRASLTWSDRLKLGLAEWQRARHQN